MKLVAVGSATQISAPDARNRAVSPGRELVPVHRETVRDHSAAFVRTQGLCETGSTPSRGSLVDILA